MNSGFAKDVMPQQVGDFQRSFHGGAVREIAKAIEFDTPLRVSLARTRDVPLTIKELYERPLYRRRLRDCLAGETFPQKQALRT